MRALVARWGRRLPWYTPRGFNRVQVDLTVAAGVLSLEISDNGVGIAPEKIGRVLEPYQTTKPNGLGMGLPLAHRVARRLGGRLDIASQPGQGTRVCLTLPARA